MWRQSPEDEIRKLKDELYFARRAIVNLMPDKISELLGGYFHCETRNDLHRWQGEAIAAIIETASPLTPHDAYFPRAYCPLCGEGSQGPYEEGFSLPEGLRRHLAGWGNCRQCSVTEAAFALAWSALESAIHLVEHDQEVAKSLEVTRRKETEILFKLGPYEEAELIDTGWRRFGESPRNPEELSWAEERLCGLGFAIGLEQRVKSYVKDYEAWVVYADPRFCRKISFEVHPKPVAKRQRRGCRTGTFYLMDAWKNDLLEKFESRCREAVPATPARRLSSAEISPAP
jgi:hypothetical protein